MAAAITGRHKRWNPGDVAMLFAGNIGYGCYTTHARISMLANAGAGSAPVRAVFLSAPRETSATIARLRNRSGTWRASVDILAKRFYVSGAVQGVGFRFFAERTANRLGVAGYVKNLFDGSVEVYAIGQAAQLDALKNELQRGPRMAAVDRVTEIDAEVLSEYSNGFTIERDY